MESAIKEHIKERSDLFNIKGLKVLNIKYLDSIRTLYEGEDGERSIMTKYEVTCSMKTKKYEDNRIKFEVNFYDNSDDGSIGIYFDGTFYEK